MRLPLSHGPLVLGPQLQIVERAIAPADRQQLFMRAALDDPPFSTNRIWSACISELSRCEMISVTRSLAKRFIAVRMRCSVPASIAAVELSNTSTDGRSIRLRAIDRRCRWPPESDAPRSPTTVV